MRVKKEDENSSKKNNLDDLESNFYYALSHEIRRKMLEIIGDNGFASFTTLKKQLKVSTGTIYHHLETLSQLIEQKLDKKYYLTDLGQHAYKYIKDNIETLRRNNFSSRDLKSPLIRTLMFLTPKPLIEQNNKKIQYYSITLSIGILILGVIFCEITKIFPFLLLFDNSIAIFPSSLINAFPIHGVFFIINFFIYFIIIEGACRLFYKQKNNSLLFLISFGTIFIPSIIYLIFHFLFIITQTIEIPQVQALDNILMIIFQAWSLWLLIYNLMIHKNLKIENALILSLLIHYGGFSIILIISL